MVGIIGYQDDVIGFGLLGINEMVELTKAATKNDVLKAVNEIKEKVNAIIISEQLLNLIKEDEEVKDLFFIEIPTEKQNVDIAQIEKLTRETLGISL